MSSDENIPPRRRQISPESDVSETQDNLPTFHGLMAISPPVKREETTKSSAPTMSLGETHPVVQVIAGPQAGGIVDIPRHRDVIIGRDRTCDLCVADDAVSRRHARIHFTAERYWIEDMGSHNGVFVKGKRVRKHPLDDDDLVLIGTKTLLKFSVMTEAERDHLRRFTNAALRDSLTGLFNRNCFDELLESECASARRHVRALSLLFFDIDDFKRVNDRQGHVAGDQVLAAVGKAVAGAVRREDLSFRYGGEEFAVLARETTLEGSIALAERIRLAVASLGITVSVGVSAFANNMRSNDLVQHADARLYVAKRTGKNRVVALDG